NFIFTQTQNNYNSAQSNPVLTASDGFGKAAQQYALRSKQIGDIFRMQFGSSRTASQLRPVLGGQNSNTSFPCPGLAYFNSPFGAANEFFKAVAVAPYVGNDLGPTPPGGWTLDNLFPNMENFIGATLAQWTDDARNNASQYGLALYAYEGGQHLTG